MPGFSGGEWESEAGGLTDSGAVLPPVPRKAAALGDTRLPGLLVWLGDPSGKPWKSLDVMCFGAWPLVAEKVGTVVK